MADRSHIHNIPSKLRIRKIESRPRIPHSFQEALSFTVHYSVLPGREIARHLGISYQALVNGSNKNLGFRFSARHIPTLLKITGNPTILEFLAKESGFCLYRLPKVSCIGDLLLPLFELDENINNFRCDLRDILSKGGNKINLDAATRQADCAIGSFVALRSALISLEKRGKDKNGRKS